MEPGDVGGGVGSPSSHAWKNTVLLITRENNAYELFTVMHRNPWAVPDLLFQAMLLESEIFHNSTSAAHYLRSVEDVKNFLYRHRGVLYNEYIYGFGAFALREFVKDMHMGATPMPRPPIPFLPRQTAPLPSFQLPLASPIPNLMVLDNIQHTAPNFTLFPGFVRSRL